MTTNSGLAGDFAGATSGLLFGGPAPSLVVPAKRSLRRTALAIHLDPLYLFQCGLLWHNHADNSAGWELIRGLRSGEPVTRAVAASLLAKTENARLLERDLRRTRSGLQSGMEETRSGQLPFRQAVQMNTPYGLEIIDSCESCRLRKEQWFCGLSPSGLQALSRVSHLNIYPGGALLFVEGQMPRGAYVLCSGKVKLSTTSREGKVLMLKMAQPGEVIGLSATISGACYELTAETAGPCHVNFIEREGLLRLMERSGEMATHCAQALSREFQSMYRDFHEMVLTRSSAGKLARLILSWSLGRENGAERIRASMTHEEMAQMIGASRETVTRLLSELKKKELIRLEGSTLVIRNRTALEALAA